MYGLVFRKVEDIDCEVAIPTPAFLTAWRDDPEQVKRNGFEKKPINNRFLVVRVKSDLVTNIDLKI